MERLARPGAAVAISFVRSRSIMVRAALALFPCGLRHPERVSSGGGGGRSSTLGRSFHPLPLRFRIARSLLYGTSVRRRCSLSSFLRRPAKGGARLMTSQFGERSPPSAAPQREKMAPGEGIKRAVEIFGNGEKAEHDLIESPVSLSLSRL